MPLPEKIRTIARRIYRAGEVEYASAAQRKLQLADRLGLSSLAVCMAKTQKSLSDDPTVVGAPEGFTLHVRDVEFAAGAGFVVPIAGDVMRMPGLPAVPAALGMDIDAQGKISGLF